MIHNSRYRAGSRGCVDSIFNRPSLDRIDNNIGVAEADANIYQTLVDLGYAEIKLQQAEDALENFDPNTAATYLEEAREYTQVSRTVDPGMADAWVIEAKSYMLQARYEEAIAVLDEAILVPGLVQNQPIAITRGQVFLAWGYQLRDQDLH